MFLYIGDVFYIDFFIKNLVLMIKQIVYFDLSRLRTEEDFGFLTKVMDLYPKLPGLDKAPVVNEGEGGASSTLIDKTTVFSEAVNEFDVVLKESTEYPTTKDLTDADAKRDAAWRDSRAFIKAMTAYPDAEKSTLAVTVLSLFDKYGDPTMLSRTEESAILHNLLQDLNAVSGDLSTVFFDGWKKYLEDSEKAYVEARKKNEDERASRITGIVKEAREKADEAYKALVDQVNALAMVYGVDYYVEFIDSLNVIISDHKTILKRRDTLNKKKRAEEESQPEPAPQPGPEQPGQI